MKVVTENAIVEWCPLPDITAYELALVLPFFVSDYYLDGFVDDITGLPDGARRHFKISLKPKKGRESHLWFTRRTTAMLAALGLE